MIVQEKLSLKQHSLNMFGVDNTTNNDILLPRNESFAKLDKDDDGHFETIRVLEGPQRPFGQSTFNLDANNSSSRVRGMRSDEFGMISPHFNENENQ